jgi:histone deacetylase 11
MKNIQKKKQALHIILIITVIIFFIGFLLPYIIPRIPSFISLIYYSINIFLVLLFLILSVLMGKEKISFRPRVYGFVIFTLLYSSIGAALIINNIFPEKGGNMVNCRGYIFYDTKYNITLYGIEKLHPFDSCKYEKIYNFLIKENIINPADVITPFAASDEMLLKIHTLSYLKELENPAVIARIAELPIIAIFPPVVLKKKILYPQRLAAGGTIAAGEIALKQGLSINLSGGYHHTQKNRSSGFCFYADVPLAIQNLIEKKMITKALIIDTDVHHGDGNAEIFQNNPQVDILDMYQNNIFPPKKYFVKYNGGLRPVISGENYLYEFKKLLSHVVPDTYDIIFHNAGSDVLASDPIGGLGLNKKDVVERDMLVAEFAYNNKIPLVIVLSGGYSRESWQAHYMSLKEIICLYYP